MEYPHITSSPGPIGSVTQQPDPQMISTPAFAAAHNSRGRDSFAFAREIQKPWGGLDPILDWCRQELEQDWRWQMVEMSTDQRPGRYIFYFDSERDCCAFALKWA